MEQIEIVREIQSTTTPIKLARNGWYSPLSFETASRIISHSPRGLTREFSAQVGRLGYLFCKERRAALRGNLEALTNDPKRLDAITQGCFENFLRMLHDFCDCAAAGTPRINALLTDRRGFEFLEQARQRGKGTLLITGHLGAWELGGMTLAADGFPVNVVTLEEPTEELNKWRQEYRDRFGIKTITVGSDKFAFVEIIQALRRNELVAMLVDRPYLNSAVDVRFFDRTTRFSSAAARISQITEASVMPAFVLQLEPGKYGCYAYPRIEMPITDTIEENSQRIANVFQSIIREFPEQWFNFVPIWHS
jgi:Kdo2-lipid IVA lauroyltransferase/acyltransferase